MTAAPHIPLSTYRLQFNRSFTFSDAADIVPYLHALGISDIYASSYLKAVPGSAHGYDVTDPTQLNPELGTEADYQKYVAALRAHGMGHIVDVVPNHMGIARSSNPWWLDVMENGPSSAYAAFFDIDWHPVKTELEDKVLLPILGDLYGLVLESQEISLAYEDGAFWVHYYDHRLPVSPNSYDRILGYRLDELIREAGADDFGLQELRSIISAASHLPPRSARDPAQIAERNREKEMVKKHLAALVQRTPRIRRFVEENVRIFNGTRGEAASFDLLDALLDDQAYRLSYWRVAAEEINYRRFFDINELVAIRMEDPQVFDTSHRLIFKLIQQRDVTGLRIDHVDGLYDPEGYLRKLQSSMKELLGMNGSERPFFLIAEKILGAGEHLPADWPVHGTTGYDFLATLNGLYVDGAGEEEMSEVYTRFTGHRLPYDELVYEMKKRIMNASMSSETNVLGHQLNRLSEKDRRSRDFTLNSLIHAIREIIACFPVYRSYITSEGVSDRDRAYIRLAVLKAKRRYPAISGLVFDFVRDLLIRGAPADTETDDERLRFVMKFQQTTSPVTAKGIEDTAFYIYNRLISLNEVGGDPEQFGVALSSFHLLMRERQVSWPFSLSATSTHDTKRSEDVRARINVLSEIPRLWRSHLRLWSRVNKKYKTDVDGSAAPDRNEEYLLYQTLLGAWPLEPSDDAGYRKFCERIEWYMYKALHEAKIHTSWVNPNQPYTGAVQKFIDAILDRTRPNPFLDDLTVLVRDLIVPAGLSNALAQTLIKITAPGIPDFYQGTELWDFSLVDPDNRRPVDFTLRGRLLSDLDRARTQAGDDHVELCRDLLRNRLDGRIKLHVITSALRYRRSHPALFLDGAYLPMEIRGLRKDHVCAYARVYATEAVLTVVPRLVTGLLATPARAPIGPDVWSDNDLVLPEETAGRTYRNLFTGERLDVCERDGHATLPMAAVLRDFPVALLGRVA